MNNKKNAAAPLHGTAAVITDRQPREHTQYTPGASLRQEPEPDRPSYWAVLPARVRYDPELRPNAKLLYAEITALSNAHGFCWVSNDRLGGWFGLSPKTIGSLIQQLQERGYLTVELLRDEKQAITGRRIWIERPAAGDAAPPILKNEETPLKNEDTPILNFEEKNNTSTKVNNPPYNPPRGGRRSRTEPSWEPEMFARFWKSYPCGKDKQGAIREWDRLRPDRKLMLTMSAALARDKASAEWQRGIGIPYACRWLSKRRWEDENRDRTPDEAPPPREEVNIRWI